ncbi:hypothetical protein A2U01_0050611, partial [Trifolium medium]|nr:hypothetical protein [Trifolium medium]
MTLFRSDLVVKGFLVLDSEKLGREWFATLFLWWSKLPRIFPTFVDVVLGLVIVLK